MLWFEDKWKRPEPRNSPSNSPVTTLRSEFELSQEAAAEALGVSRSLVALAETGRRKLGLSLDEVRRRFDAYTANRDADRELMRRLLGGAS